MTKKVDWIGSSRADDGSLSSVRPSVCKNRRRKSHPRGPKELQKRMHNYTHTNRHQHLQSDSIRFDDADENSCGSGRLLGRVTTESNDLAYSTPPSPHSSPLFSCCWCTQQQQQQQQKFLSSSPPPFYIDSRTVYETRASCWINYGWIKCFMFAHHPHFASCNFGTRGTGGRRVRSNHQKSSKWFATSA